MALMISVTRCWRKNLPKYFRKLPKQFPQRFFLYKLICFKIAKKSPIYLGYFCKLICDQNFLKLPNLVTLLMITLSAY